MSCPICGKPPAPRYRPFCSRRCSDVDLAHWLRGNYAIPDEDAELSLDESDEAASPPQEDRGHRS